MPATTPTAPSCTRPACPELENTRPRFGPCSAHRVRPQRPHRPRSRPVYGLPLRQLASDPSVPVEGGSCNDYDYVCGGPVNGFDLDGTRTCIKGGTLASRSTNHVRAHICVVGRSKKDRAQGLVRVEFEVHVRGFWQRQETVSVEAFIRADNGEYRQDRGSPFDPIHPQFKAHASIALRRGQKASVYGVAHLASGDVEYFGYFTTPDESIYDQ